MGTRHGPEIEGFVTAARGETGEPIVEFEVSAFGDSPGMADELVALVLSGRKRATAGLLEPYEAEGNALPAVGGFSVVLNGEGAPAALIRTREVTIRAFRDVDEDFAREEGEGDLSLRYWREGHRDFFTRHWPGFDEGSSVICEKFELVYPR